MIDKKYVAYEGQRFTVEWYLDGQGKSKAREYFEELPLDRKKKLKHLMQTIGDYGQIHSEEKFRNEGDKIYAFKPSPDRFLCFFSVGSKVIITNAFEKKTDKLPPREKDRALKYRFDYLQRNKEGKYYG